MRKGKNSHGQGGIRKIKEGVYQIHFRIPDPITGRTKRHFVRVDAETQRDALKEKARIEQEYKGLYGKHTFGEVAEQWLRVKKNMIAETTHDRYKSAMTTIWMPALGSKQLKKVTDTDIERVLADYSNSSAGRLSNEPTQWTIHGQYRVVRTFLNWCVKKKLIPYSPHETADIVPVSGEFEVTTVPKEWIDKLMDACETHEERTLINLYCMTGMRLSEAFGLRMTDVDYEEDMIRVSMQTPRGKLTELKGHNKKSISIPAFLTDMIKQQEIDIKKRKLELGAFYQDNNLLFPEQNGQPKKAPHNFSRKIRMRAGWIPCNACVGNNFTSGHDCAQRPRYKLHDIRHTVGTMLAGKVDLFIVQKILGHKSIKTTEEYYIGAVTPDQRKATKVLEEFYNHKEAN